MKSVKRIFKKRLSPYNLRSRKAAVPAVNRVKSSTPKVNREVQASLSEEENCTLLFELPYHPSSLEATTRALNLSEEIQPSQPSNQPRYSTAFSEPTQVNQTNREAIDISLEPNDAVSFVQASTSRQITPDRPREASSSSSLEDFTPIDSRIFHSGPRIALEVEEISEASVERPISPLQSQETSAEHKGKQIINSETGPRLEVSGRINYTKTKQSKKIIRSDSVSSEEFSSTETDSEREYSEDSEVKDIQKSNRKSRKDKKSESSEEHKESKAVTMEPDELTDLQRQVIDVQRQMCKQLKDTQAAMENVASPEPTVVKPTLFRGYENENVDRWLQRFTLYLANRKIREGSDQAAIQLALHLLGPAESFYYNLPSTVQRSFDQLKNALRYLAR